MFEVIAFKVFLLEITEEVVILMEILCMEQGLYRNYVYNGIFVKGGIFNLVCYFLEVLSIWDKLNFIQAYNTLLY